MVPPPMSVWELSASGTIADCAVSLCGTRVILMTAAGIEVYDLDLESKPPREPTKTASLSLASQAEIWSKSRLRQVVVQGRDRVSILSESENDKSKITKFAIENSLVTLVDIATDIDSADSDQAGLVRNILTDSCHKFLWRQNATGFTWCERPDLSTSTAHPSCEIVLVGGQDDDDKRDHDRAHDGQPFDYAHIFSLSRKGELFANGKLLTKGCTSFVTTDAYLVLTTTQHLLKFVHLGISDSYELPGDNPEPDERCRNVERGAKLVTVIPSIYAVVLQMPRGNLETIYPRALVLSGIRQHLDERDFKSAFLACQNHQVDVNILHDYRPALLMSNILLFIEQVKKISRIDVFLSKLSPDDVSKTLYKNTLVRRGRSTRDPAGGEGVGTPDEDKVNHICDAFLSVLERNVPQRLQNVITAHVSKRPPDLVAALRLVASLRQTDGKQAEEAISHLCFLSDVNRLYDTALSMYDLPLTLLVAQQAQRDPREYMPFLESLNTLPPLRRNFEIDDNLHNYAKALDSLHGLDVHDEVEKYTVKHALYSQALKLYRYEPKHLATITRLQVGYLTSKSNHLASAIASESLSDYSLASSSYVKCSPPRWREALHCASMIQPPLPQGQVQSLCLQLVRTLSEEQHDYRSAAQIHVDYLHDASSSAQLLCRGSYFAESQRLLSLHNLASQIPEIVDTALVEKSGEISELMANCRSQLSAQSSRIGELRIKESEDPLAFFGGDQEQEQHGEMADNISLAPTDASTMGGQSLFTRYTGHQSGKFVDTNRTSGSSTLSRHTSKTRRKEERNRARGKKGSVYEEEYLVGSVRRLIERVNGVHSEVGRLVEGLLRRGMRSRAENIEELMQAVTSQCEGAVGEIWAAVATNMSDGDQVTPPNGADAVFWESQMEARQRQQTKETVDTRPQVKSWKPISI